MSDDLATARGIPSALGLSILAWTLLGLVIWVMT